MAVRPAPIDADPRSSICDESFAAGIPKLATMTWYVWSNGPIACLMVKIFILNVVFEEWSKVTVPMPAKNSQSWLFLLAVIRCYLAGVIAKQ
jgi:hypothetical protein